MMITKQKRNQMRARMVSEKKKTRHTAARRSSKVITNVIENIRGDSDISGGYYTGFEPPKFQ